MTETEFFEKIKLSAQNYKAKSDNETKTENKNPISWRKATYHALYNIAPGMAADSLVMARRKSGSLDSSSGGSWEDDKTSQEITRTFMNLFIEKYGSLDSVLEKEKQNSKNKKKIQKQKNRRHGKKNSLKILMATTGMLTSTVAMMILAHREEKYDESCALGKLEFHLMEFFWLPKRAAALLNEAKILPRKKKKAQKKEALEMKERLSSVWNNVQKTFSQINPQDENRNEALSTLTGLYNLYDDCDNLEIMKILKAIQALFCFSDSEIEEEKKRCEENFKEETNGAE